MQMRDQVVRSWIRPSIIMSVNTGTNLASHFSFAFHLQPLFQWPDITDDKGLENEEGRFLSAHDFAY